MCWPETHKKLDNLMILSGLKAYAFYTAHFFLNKASGDWQWLYSIIRKSFKTF